MRYGQIQQRKRGIRKLKNVSETLALSAIQVDITTLKVDAIVNAAKTSLLGGGGVDGAIHNAAGPGLLEECQLLNGCMVGDAKITEGYNLPAKYVIHTVGPVWYGGKTGEVNQLTSCYRTCLEVAVMNGIRTIAFPAISTGIYGYPIKKATLVAIRTVRKFLRKHPTLEVFFCCFSDSDLNDYKSILRRS